MLLGERFDRMPFVCQPLRQRFLLDPPCLRKPEFTRNHAGAVDADPDSAHFAIVIWKSRHNLFQDHISGCLTKIVLENRQGALCLRIAASFYQLGERSSELRGASGKRFIEKSPPSKLELLPVLSEPQQSLADCELRIFREHLFQFIELNRRRLKLLFIAVLGLPEEPSRNYFVESLLLNLSDLNKGQPGGLLTHPLHIGPINHERPLQAWHIDAQF